MAGQQAPSADNSQPWGFRCSDNEITVEYATARLAGETFGPAEPASLIALGGVLENMLQAAAFVGIGASWRLGREDGPVGNPSLTVTLGQGFDQPDPSPSIFSHPLFGRHTNRFPYQSRPIPPEAASDVQKPKEGSTQIIRFDAPTDIHALASIARQASEVRFQTQEIHEWLARSLRFTKKEASRGDGLDLATLPLPPGGGLLMRLIMDWKWMKRLNRLGAYKLLAAMDVKLLEKAPAVIALVGGASHEEAVEAGRLLTRTWIELNTKGIAVHPYYVVSDQLQRRLDGKVPNHLISQADAIAERTATLFNLSGNQRLHMLLRIGYPTKDPIRSKRLPFEIACQQTHSP